MAGGESLCWGGAKRREAGAVGTLRAHGLCPRDPARGRRRKHEMQQYQETVGAAAPAAVGYSDTNVFKHCSLRPSARRTPPGSFAHPFVDLLLYLFLLYLTRAGSNSGHCRQSRQSVQALLIVTLLHQRVCQKRAHPAPSSLLTPSFVLLPVLLWPHPPIHPRPRPHGLTFNCPTATNCAKTKALLVKGAHQAVTAQPSAM